MRLIGWMMVLAAVMGSIPALAGTGAGKVRAVYSNMVAFNSRQALDRAILTEPSYLLPKHKKMMAAASCERSIALAKESGFDTVFLSIYPLYGMDWRTIPSARNLVKDAIAQASKHFRVHIGFSLYNARVTQDPSRYPGALQAVAWDGKRPDAVCFLDDSLWDFHIGIAVELAKISQELPGCVEGIFLDPEPYGPEAFLCFCDNCLRKFNRYAGTQVPLGQIKPFDWIVANGLMNRYIIDWHDQEVRRHARELQEAVHRINPRLRLSTFLYEFPWDPVEKRQRETFWRNLAFGLGTEKMPSWAMPEHTYYDDAKKLASDIEAIREDIEKAGFGGKVEVLPGLMPVGQRAESLIERAKVIKTAPVVGFWLFQLSALEDGTTVTPDGSLLEPAANYRRALKEASRILSSQ